MRQGIKGHPEGTPPDPVPSISSSKAAPTRLYETVPVLTDMAGWKSDQPDDLHRCRHHPELCCTAMLRSTILASKSPT